MSKRTSHNLAGGGQLQARGAAQVMSYDMTEDTPQGTKYSAKQSVAGEKSVDSQPAASSMPVAISEGLAARADGGILV